MRPLSTQWRGRPCLLLWRSWKNRLMVATVIFHGRRLQSGRCILFACRPAMPGEQSYILACWGRGLSDILRCHEHPSSPAAGSTVSSMDSVDTVPCSNASLGSSTSNSTMTRGGSAALVWQTVLAAGSHWQILQRISGCRLRLWLQVPARCMAFADLL